MNDAQARVCAFHRAFYLPSPEHLDFEAFTEVRIRLLEEEVKELRDAWELRDIVEMVDALADIEYVLYGAAVSLGIDLEPFSKEVHRSNMTKVWPDGTIHYRDDGKVMKPDTYSPANILGLLQERYPNSFIFI